MRVNTMITKNKPLFASEISPISEKNFPAIHAALTSEKLPQWPHASTSSVRSENFQALLSSLCMVKNAIAATVPKDPAELTPDAANETLRLYGRAYDLGTSLLTLCRAHTGLSPTATDTGAARAEVLGILVEIRNHAEPAFQVIRNLVGNEPVFARTPELKIWKRIFDSEPSLADGLPSALSSYTAELEATLLSPLSNLFTHLMSPMALEVRTQSGEIRTQGFGSSIAVMKTSDDPELRRTTFNAMNAWLASHGSAIADLLNAITGFRITVLKAADADLLERATRSERVSLQSYRAMFDAIEMRLGRLRQTVDIRQSRIGKGPMRVANILAPAPESFYAEGRPYARTLTDLINAFAAIDKGFTPFLESLHSRKQIDCRPLAQNSGGTWCDDLPALDEVRILSNYRPTLAGAFALSHLLGVARHRSLMHKAPSASRFFPLSVTEIAGSFYEAIFTHHLLTQATSPIEKVSVRWQALIRIGNLLLTLPARHRLLLSILRERSENVLPVSRLNQLSDDAWRHYYGNTTVETDRYLWAYKQHFYRMKPIFYDWQYTFGFLIAAKLAREFLTYGKSACDLNIEEMWLESGSMSTEDWVLRHTGDNIRSVDFWLSAIDAVLEPFLSTQQAAG